jgi:hypothetical protein
MDSRVGATFVILWSQSLIGTSRNAPLYGLVPGAIWWWTGEAVRMDRDATAPAGRPQDGFDLSQEPLPASGFIVSDGQQRFQAVLLECPGTGDRLVMFEGAMPPAGQPLRVMRSRIDPTAGMVEPKETGGVVGFTPETWVATPQGQRLIGELQQGDLIQTKDDGALPVVWLGKSRMSGARLFAMPRLRPVRFRAGALGIRRPASELIVSPQQRMLVKAGPVRALYNTPEVLVSAEDLVNGTAVAVDLVLKEVVYVHLLLERHSIIFVNGLEAESFHPATAAFGSIEPAQRSTLASLLPGIEADPDRYGAFARRSLSSAEVAILRHDLAA